MKKTLYFLAVAPLALAALAIQAWRLRDFSLPEHEMWE